MRSSQIRTNEPERGTDRPRRPSPTRVVPLIVVAAAAGLLPAHGQSPPARRDPAALLKALLSGVSKPGKSSEQPAAGDADAQAAEPDEAPRSQAISMKVSGAGLIELHVRGASVRSVIEMLSFQLQTNIVASQSVDGQVTAHLYNVTLPEALDAILTPSGYTYMTRGNVVYVGTPEEIRDLLPPPETRVFRLRYVSPDEAAKAVRALLGEQVEVTTSREKTGSAAGGAPGTAAGGGPASLGFGPTSVDYLIITAPRPQLEQAGRLLDELDVRPKQVLIEATILRATLNENNELGIDFTLLGGVDFQNVSATSNTATDITTGQLRTGDFEKTTFNINTNLTGGLPNNGFTFGIIKNSVAFFVRALEEVTDVTVVANPKIIALNRQPAEVIVGRRDGYLTTTVTQTAAVQTVQFLETGTQIRLRPYINDDGTVRLSVHPKDSNGGLTSANLPFEETTEAHADILVPDGHTVLIGGLFRERSTASRGQVPLLGDLPVIGPLFQSHLDQTVREEVIILLTVHVLKDTPEEQKQFSELLDDVERIRVGSRRGLLWTGRERLAQAFYQEAVRQLGAGHEELALLNVRMALHNNPRHLAAIRLKEQLLGRRMWDNPGSRIRSVLLDLIRSSSNPPAHQPSLGRPESERRLLLPTTQPSSGRSP